MPSLRSYASAAQRRATLRSGRTRSYRRTVSAPRSYRSRPALIQRRTFGRRSTSLRRRLSRR